MPEIIVFTGHRDRYVIASYFTELAAEFPQAQWWCGGALDGFDVQMIRWAKRLKMDFRVIRPDYRRFAAYPKFAPLQRNYDMVDAGQLVVTCWDGRVVGGTFDCRKYALKVGREVRDWVPVPIVDF